MSVVIIAEAGVNHNGSFEMAVKLIDEAVRAGADIVKFQTFKATQIASGAAPKADYQEEMTGIGTQVEMLSKLELDETSHRALKAHAERRGIEFLSSPFDLDSLDLLLSLGLTTIKIGSGEITNGLLLHACASRGLNVILSTGMSTLREVEDALGLLSLAYLEPESTPDEVNIRSAYESDAGQAKLLEHVVLLHCTTEYPAPFEEVNLNAMVMLGEVTNLPVGYSDHTRGIEVPMAAVAMGAVVIEKHFTLDRTLPGPDHRASIEPDQLSAMIDGIRNIEHALGQREKVPSRSELRNLPIARKSLVASKPIRRGELFSPENLSSKRPATGLSPMRYWALIGLEADRNYDVDDLIEMPS